MSAKSAIALLAAAFLVTLIVRLPAAWAARLLPAAVQCQGPDGTLWQGSCAALRTTDVSLTDVHWVLQPLALLSGRLALELQSDDARASGNARVMVRIGGDLDVESLHARLPLAGGLTPLPPGWNGELSLAIDQASVRAHRLTALKGTITAEGLRRERPALDLGSFELTFPGTPAPAAPMIGTLRDLGGPLSLQGQLRLAPDGAYELAGTLAARDRSNTDLQQLLQMLGPPDAAGAHAFSIAGTL
jgi:general secretion pathway protein N